jgi:RNA polymerase sigma-70 factor (ECF subfamily)
VDGVKRRAPEAWRRLAQLYGPLVYRWCRRSGLGAPDAEDVLQEVFLTVATRIGEFQPDQQEGSFRGWLRTITRHKVGDWMRRQARSPHTGGGPEVQQMLLDAPAPEADADPPETGALYHRALALIREEFEESTWQAFWRVVVEARSTADVAAALGISRNAVYIARCRVLRRLREAIGDG